MSARTRIAVLAALLSCLLLGGCQGLFVMIEKMFPDEKVPPKFKLPEGKTVLVFPDDVNRPLSYSPIKRIVADKTSELLKQHKLAARTIPYERLVELEQADPEYYRRHIPSVGRRLGADLVVYVHLDQFALKETPVDTLWSGRLAGKVRVVDVNKGRIWPDEAEGYPVQVAEPDSTNLSETYGEELARRLGDLMAQEIVGLFREHWVERARPPDSQALPPE